MTTKQEDDVLVWLDSARGQYIPQAFAECWKDRAATVSGVDSEDWAILEAGPDHEHYWDAWNSVEQDARCKLDEGKPFTVYMTENGDCLLVRVGFQPCESCGEWYDASDADANDFECASCCGDETD